MTDFQELSLHPRIQKALENMEFSAATEVQAAVIPQVLAGKDVLVTAKTGSGKTGAFILPILHHCLGEGKPNTSTRCLILLPTRELALQIHKVFEQFAAFTYIKAGLLIGGEPFKYQISVIRKNPEVIIATPGRLVEHIEKGHVDFNDLEFLVLDEADRMLDMGFAEEMDTIAKQCRPERQNLLFSATLRHKGFKLLREMLKEPEILELNKADEVHTDIIQQMVLADDDSHKEKLVPQLIHDNEAKRVFVFCKTRAQCQRVSNILRSKKVIADYLHGEISQSDRKQVMNRFRDGKLQALVATDVAARGLDISDIDLVINFSMAQSGDEHVHRVGRTGRAGQKGKAICLVSSLEWNLMSSIERYLKVRFEKISVKGLEAKYTGPKKVKASGKAAGSKKKKKDSPYKNKPKKTLRGGDAKTKKQSKSGLSIDGGYGTIKRKKKD